jgi:hypothetical protein
VVARMSNTRNLSRYWAMLVLTFACTPAADAVGGASAAGDTRTIVLKLSDLRSAYLIRAGVVQYDATSTSPESIRAQLQRHFDVVIGLLLVSTPHSIDSAVARLENSAAGHWSTTSRDQMRQRLFAMRYLQIRRLADYRDRGRFPLNEGQSPRSIPIFVDNHDTACAVGHLMHLSGSASDVASIQNSSNNVYIWDISDGPLARWVLTSGLTMEEAALIQPEYGPFFVQPPRPDDAIEVVESRWSGIIGELRFSNFKILPQTTEETANIPVSHGSCSYFSCYFPSPDAPRILIQFDVETVSPLQLLASRPRGSHLLAVLGEPASYTTNEFGMFLDDNMANLFLDYSNQRSSDQPVPNNFGVIDLRPFEPTNRMTVVADIVASGVPYEALRLSFDVLTIPEPGAAASLLPSALIFMYKRRPAWRNGAYRNAPIRRCILFC